MARARLTRLTSRLLGSARRHEPWVWGLLTVKESRSYTILEGASIDMLSSSVIAQNVDALAKKSYFEKFKQQ